MKRSRRHNRKIPVLVLVILAIGIVAGLFWWQHRRSITALPHKSATVTKQTHSLPSERKHPQSFDSKRFSLTNPSSPWVVVSKARPLSPVQYAPTDLTSVGNGQYVRKEASVALQKMFSDARNAGLAIQADSGYRSYQTQVVVYGNEVKNYGQAVADTESARPGHSEHQTGWAVDVGGGGCHIDNCFAKTPEGKWVAANAYKYGFIVRYTAAKQYITGYRAEPWHLRYVGTYLSKEMHRRHIVTLEEFFGLPSQNAY